MIICVSKDPGDLEGMLPVVRDLRQTHEVAFFVSGKALDLMMARNLFVDGLPGNLELRQTLTGDQFIPCAEPDDILGLYPRPQMLVTGMSSGGGVGRDLVPFLHGFCPTVALQDFWGARLWTDWHDILYRPDYLTVNDPVGRSIVIHAWPDMVESQIPITGFPALDRYAGYDSVAANREVHDRLDLSEGMPIVLFGGQVKGTGQVLQELVDCLNEMGRDIYFIPRMHPRMEQDSPADIQLWERALESFTGGTIIRDTSAFPKIQPLAAAASVTLSMFSTCLIEAACLGRPNIAMLYPEQGARKFREDNGGVMNEFPLVSLHCSLKAEDRTELYWLLEKVLDGHIDMSEAQAKHFRQDGGNAKRVADFIRGLL